MTPHKKKYLDLENLTFKNSIKYFDNKDLLIREANFTTYWTIYDCFEGILDLRNTAKSLKSMKSRLREELMRAKNNI